MGSNGQYDDLARTSSAGASSGDGDSGGGGEAAPPAPPRPASPSRDPIALGTSPPPLQPPRSPPRPADGDTDEGPDYDDMPEDEDDGDFNWDQEEADYNSIVHDEYLEDVARASSARASSGGGEAAQPAPPRLPLSPPPASPSREPNALSTSPPLLQPPGPPPRPADGDTDEGPDYDDMPKDEDDGDFNWDQEEADYNSIVHDEYLEDRQLEDDADMGDDQDQGENLTGKFFSILYMSVRRNVPDVIIRNGFLPLNKHDYFSWHQIWSMLLDRYLSFLRLPKDHRVLNGGFRRPYDYPRALGLQEPISNLIHESSNIEIIKEKIKILSKQYGFLRRTWSACSCFYRALLFSYLENPGQMQDRQAEVIRLMKCVEVSIKRFNQLEWEEAYFLNPEDYFLSVVYEFYHLVNSVANGLTSDKLHARSLEVTSSGRIISFLRLLTEVEIRTPDIYKPYIPKDMNVLQFCWKKVRGLYSEAGSVQMRALTYALGIPLRVEIVDTKSTPDQDVRVKRLDFFRQSSPGKGRVHIVRSYYSLSTAHKPLKRGRDGDLLSSDGAPLVTLLSRHGHCDILYPK